MSTGLVQRVKTAASALVARSTTISLRDLAHYFGRDPFGPGTRPTRSYGSVAAVYSAVRARATALSSMPLKLSSGDDQVIESGPAVDLIEQPNPRMTRRAFWEAVETLALLFGKVHFVMSLDSLGRPVEVVPVAPPQMRANRDRRTGEVISWTYRAAGSMAGTEVTLSPEEVHTIRDPDFERPEDPLAALSPRQAVTLAISQYFKSDIANEASLDNGVQPSGALTMEGEPSQVQRDDLRSQLDHRHSGAGNRKRFLLLFGGMKWQQMGMSHRDAEVVELKKIARVDICSAFNVPPSVCGYFEDSNYAHADAASRDFWINTVCPRAARMAEEWGEAVLSKWQGDRSLRSLEAAKRQADAAERLSRGFKFARATARRRGTTLYAWFDSNGIPAVQRANLELAQQAKEWNSIGVPLNSILRATDAPFEETPWGNTWYHPISLMPVDATPLDTIDDPPGPPDDPDTPDSRDAPDAPDGGGDEAVRSGRQGRRSGASGSSGGGKAGGNAEKLYKATDAQLSRMWAKWRKSWEGLERAADSKLRRHFNELRSQTLRRLFELMPKADSAKDASGAIPPVIRRDLLGEILFDLSVSQNQLIATTGPLLREATRLGGEQTMSEAAEAQGGDPDEADPFNIEADEVVAAMRQREVRLASVDQTLRDQVRESIAEGLEQVETVDQIAERLRSKFNFASSRAKTIARTEVGAAVEEGRSLARRQAGVPLKSWLWSRKEQGRRAHAFEEQRTMADPVPMDGEFTVNGHTCRHPRDTSLPASESVNCGCTTVGRYPNDGLRSVLARYEVRGFLDYDQLRERDQRRQAPAGGNSATEQQEAA